jgi:hypothetical protein
MPEERTVKKVYKWKPMLRRPLGRPKNRWEDDIINYMKLEILLSFSLPPQTRCPP